jgi:glycosyltransferase involved in cell wall biosynthesis
VLLAGHADTHNPACIEQATLDAWRDEGVVTLMGQRDDIPSLLRGAHIAVLPSYREGMPKALLEAAAAGRPMVATDVPGCREVVRAGATGLLVAPRDPEQLAAALRKLAADRALRTTMGAAARRMAEQEYSDTAAAAATVDLWERFAR